MINLDQQIKLFKDVGDILDEKIECLVIGGSAMMFYGAKVATKDIDLVFMNKNNLEKVKKILEKSGYEEKNLNIFKRYTFVKKDLYKPIWMQDKDTRIDLFLKKVICFWISENILNRIKEVHEFNNLIIKIISPEDIILLKCATEREKDRMDALELINKFNIDWDIIIKESIEQAKLGENIFPVFLFDFLYELKEDLKADIPKDVINKIRNISEKLMIEKFKKDKKG